MKQCNNYIEDGRVIIEKKKFKDRAIRWFQVYINLAFIRWANIRNEWYFHILLTPLFPLGLLTFLKLSGAIENPAYALYITAGNSIMSLIIGPMQSISNDLALNRERKDLDFLATLPISKLQLILGFTTISTIFTIPGMLLTLIIGKIWLKFPVVIHPLMIVVMLVSGLSMVGVGVFFGVHARNIHHANIMNTLALMAVTFLSPVLIPKENLPKLLFYISRLFPTSYAADALRAVLLGTINKQFYINMSFLLVFTFITLYLSIKK